LRLTGDADAAKMFDPGDLTCDKTGFVLRLDF